MIYKHCVFCGGELIHHEDAVYKCTSCKKETYNNVAACTTVFLLNSDRTKVLMGLRAREPKKGMLDSLGGFINPGEQPAEAGVREMHEETGLEVKLLDIVSVQTDFYMEDTYTTSICYAGELISGEPKPNDDVAELVWLKLKDVENQTYAFDFIRPALLDLVAWVDKNS